MALSAVWNRRIHYQRKEKTFYMPGMLPKRVQGFPGLLRTEEIHGAGTSFSFESGAKVPGISRYQAG
jgi:hypothetical protein